MGSQFSRIKNVSTQYKDYPPGCVPCPHGNTPGNPGTFEEIHKKFDSLNPKPFHGEEQFEGYKFGASYVGTKRVGYAEKYPILDGEILPNGDLKANFVHTLGCRCRIKVSTQVKKRAYKNLKFTTEYRLDDLTLSATLVDPKILKQEGVLILQYLQAITPRITLGAEIAYNRIPNLSKQQSNIACAFRYSTGFRTISATVSPAGFRLCYHQRQSSQLQMGVELQSNIIKPDCKARLFYQLHLPAADMLFKGFVDTHWKLGAVFEKKLYPIPEASLMLSALLDHSKQNVSVGIGLNIVG
ncbi:mitochondrial import receptor subunit TOM40 homolog 2-like [Phymastichus coffea]|uniref:mitochondrial import receptor subunit TOM40 homolog 2-like n=1 Tax=Phymastichus coffea TaxID=108790 RepID=UPI00273B53FC|nr:mitochondrial import receptor subunit TOM40 homolog 2-like [Phymastichus coffea]